MMEFTQRNKVPHFDENVMPFVFLSAYETMVKKTLKSDYLLAYCGTQNALMPFRKYSVKGFTLLQPLSTPVSLDGNLLTKENEKLFLDEVVKTVAEQKLAIRIIQAYSYVVFNAPPNKSLSCPFGTYILNLENNTEEKLFANLDPKKRNKIRNAQKNNVVIRWGNSLEDFYTLYSATMKRSNMFCEPYSYFKELSEQMGAQHVLCGVSYHEDRPQAAVFIPFSKYGGYYLYGATTDKLEQAGAMDILQWELIKKLKHIGVKKYDFTGARLSNVSGTKLDGIQDFKKKFGGELIEGFLWKINIDNAKCLLFDNLIKLNNTLKGNKAYMDIIDEENAKKN